MSQTTLTLIITLCGVIVSLVLSVFMGGMRWGEVKSEMRYMNDRLAKIEGMFTLTPRDRERESSSDNVR